MLKIETVEQRQVPRWVFAMMNANKDPTDLSDSPADRASNVLAAREMHARRKERDEQEKNRECRTTGLEWKYRYQKSTFNKEELDQIMPTRRVGFVMNRTLFTSIVIGIVALFTLMTVAVGISVCAELKQHVSAKQAWASFTSSPTAYYHHVVNAFDW